MSTQLPESTINSAAMLSPGQTKVMNVKVYNTYAEIEGPNQKKSVTIPDLVRAISASYEETTDSEIDPEPILMPYGCFAFNLGQTTAHINCYYPESKRKIEYFPRGFQKSEFEIPFPNTIIFFKLMKTANGWEVQDVRYTCTNKTLGQLTSLSASKFIRRSDTSSGIFEMPFTNFYSGSNTMCYGGNDMPRRLSLKDLRLLDYYFQVIFVSPFNDDLGISNVRNLSSYKGWYEELAGLEKFPYGRLTK